jgi:hypothetical protein
LACITAGDAVDGDLAHVRDGQRIDDRIFGRDGEAIHPGDLHTDRERVRDAAQEPEQEERDDHRQQRQRGTDAPPEETRPDERQPAHARADGTEPPLVELQVWRACCGLRVVRHHDDGLAVVTVQQARAD